MYVRSIRHCWKAKDKIIACTHTAPEWCQPEMFATLSFSAVLFVCDQDKNLHVAQQIL